MASEMTHQERPSHRRSSTSPNIRPRPARIEPLSPSTPSSSKSSHRATHHASQPRKRPGTTHLGGTLSSPSARVPRSSRAAARSARAVRKQRPTDHERGEQALDGRGMRRAKSIVLSAPSSQDGSDGRSSSKRRHRRARGTSISQHMDPHAREEVQRSMAEIFNAATCVLTSNYAAHYEGKIEETFSRILQLAREIQVHLEGDIAAGHESLRHKPLSLHSKSASFRLDGLKRHQTTPPRQYDENAPPRRGMSNSTPRSPGHEHRKRKSTPMKPSLLSRLEQAIISTGLTGAMLTGASGGSGGGTNGVRNAHDTTATARALASSGDKQKQARHSSKPRQQHSGNTLTSNGAAIEGTHRKSMSVSSTATSSSRDSAQGGADMKIVGSASSDESLLLSAQGTGLDSVGLDVDTKSVSPSGTPSQPSPAYCSSTSDMEDSAPKPEGAASNSKRGSTPAPSSKKQSGAPPSPLSPSGAGAADLASAGAVPQAVLPKSILSAMGAAGMSNPEFALDPQMLSAAIPSRASGGKGKSLVLNIVKCTQVYKNQPEVAGGDFYCIARSKDAADAILEETRTITVKNTREPRFDTTYKNWRRSKKIARIEIELYEAGSWRDKFMGACFVERSEITGKKMRMKLLSKTFEYDKKSPLTGFLELKVDFE